MTTHRLAFAVLLATAPAPASPDLIAGGIDSVNHYGEVAGAHAYSFGATVCNVGFDPTTYNHLTNQHPVIAQHLYRIADGRLEQIGMSWAFHTFFALEQGICATCTPVGGGSLGPGCATSDAAGILGGQPQLGPRFEINAATGAFDFPFSNPGGELGDIIFKRVQVPTSLLSPDATYIAELQVLSPEDLGATATNNASHRTANLQPNGSLTLSGDTQRERPAILAWADLDPDVVVRTIDIPGDGRFHAAAKVINQGDGTWRYHYAIHNLNSHRAANGIIIPAFVFQVTDTEFHAPHYHSGSPVDNVPWEFTPGAISVAWFAPEHTPANDLSANALRWGTTYTFSMTAPAPPVEADATVYLFRPGAENSFSVSLPVPGAQCLADLAAPFGQLDFSDVLAFLLAFAAEDPAADLGAPTGVFDFSDVTAFLTAFSAGCP